MSLDPILEDMDEQGNLPGYETYRTDKGYEVLHLWPWADPAKRSPEWLERVRKTMPDEREFRREFLLDWTTPSETGIYPGYGPIREHVLKAAPGVLEEYPIYRGWDFGTRGAACVWMQLSGTGRLWFLREVLLMEVDTYVLRDVVRFLSGEAEEHQLSDLAKRRIDLIAADARYPNPPFFEPTARPRTWIDFGSHEALQTRAEVAMDSEARTSQQILAAAGIELRVWSGSVKSRIDVLRHAFRRRTDGTYGAYVDPACVLLDEGFSAGFRYKAPTKLDPVPHEPLKDGKYEHLHDAAGYVAVNILSLDDKPRVWEGNPEDILGYEGRKVIRRKDFMDASKNQLDWTCWE